MWDGVGERWLILVGVHKLFLLELSWSLIRSLPFLSFEFSQEVLKAGAKIH